MFDLKASAGLNKKSCTEDSAVATHPISITPTPKRTKYDTGESIFNLID